MEATKVGVLVTVLIVLIGLGMYFMNDYTGALVTSGSYKCEETENLFATPDNDLEAKQSIFKKGGTKTKVGSRVWNNVVPETCSGNMLTERYCLSGGTATSETVTCVNGCSNGKCNDPPIDCTDSDNGQDYLSEGTTAAHVFDIKESYYLGMPPNTQSKSISQGDGCSGNVLTEYYCDGINIESTTFDCGSLTTFGAVSECRINKCVISEIFCDGIDNDNDGQIDENCDDDNDDYCNSNMFRSVSYSCSGSNNCCPLGGGDCDEINSNANPGIDEEDCMGYGDENCDGVADGDAGCSYTCVESGSTYDVKDFVVYPIVVTITASDGGLVTYYNPSCSPLNFAYRSCVSGDSKAIDDEVGYSCSTGCIDPDGPEGPEPAGCDQPPPVPDFDEALPPFFKKYP